MSARRPVKNLIYFLLLAFVSYTAQPLAAHDPAAKGSYFDFNTPARNIYQQILHLQIEPARKALEQFRQQEPDNLIGVFLENYADFFTVFTSDNKQEFKRLRKNMEPRVARIARGDRHSPYFLYTQAEIRLQWAFLHLRYGEYLSAMSDVKQAYALLDENLRRYPDFPASKKSLGVMHVIVGNVPDEYKWAVKALGGMSGNMQQGMQELESLLEYARTNDFIFEDETTVLHSVVLSYFQNAPDQAFKKIKDSRLDLEHNPLAAFTAAVIAMRAGLNDDAIRLLQQAPRGAGYAAFPFRDFLLGITKLRRLDTDAPRYLETFVQQTRGDNNVKEAFQKMAWHHLVHGDETSYRNYQLSVKSRGIAHTEPDKAALKEAESGQMPDARLLKARLLFDGGYYQRAYELLRSDTNPYTWNRMFQLEYQYRMGRIVHKLGKTKEAEQYYRQTIEYGARDPWYFACNAALQLGFLYESKKETANARQAFQTCLDLHPDDYAAGLHAQAKAGLSRLKKI
jgi:tetratricopeptide (TPR) repeat protein